MRVIAMYLPQFHSVKENDEWWGEGFTEWTAAKLALPLFERHNQPRVPLGNYYYNLLEKETMEWQAELMRRYGVDGVCMYHYWFKDGRQMLEKPAENLLQWTDVDMPYCFCWANETWARSWSRISEKNTWADLYEPQKKEGELLLEQEYGGESDWEAHFAYLLPFFLDRRYIKIDGRPVFVIYKTSLVKKLRGMLALWNELARKNGLPGIYVIGSMADYTVRDALDAELYIEPAGGRSYVSPKERNGCMGFDYDAVWNSILAEIPIREQTFFGGFTDYDDTPRRGRNGKVTLGASQEKFGEYLAKLMAKNKAYGMDIVFLNAWNEWGEGMYLEPDQKNGYGFLEKIAYAKECYLKWMPDYLRQKEMYDAGVRTVFKEKEKKAGYVRLLDKWMTLLENGGGISQYFLQKGYREIAVYGYGDLGRHVVKELRGTPIRVRYVVDVRDMYDAEGITFYKPDEKLPKADVMVVSAFYAMEEIKKKLEKNRSMPLLSLEAILDELCDEIEVER